MTFRLNGKADIPDPQLALPPRNPKTAQFGDDALIETGFNLYHYNCRVCHGPLAISSGVLPDLRWSATTADPLAWQTIVLGGALAGNGMVAFDNVLSEGDAEAIRAYIVKQAHEGAALETEAAALTATDAATM